MIRLILFAFIGFYILTGTNFGKSFMEENNFLEEGRGIKSITEKLIGNETTKQEIQEADDTNQLHDTTASKKTFKEPVQEMGGTPDQQPYGKQGELPHKTPHENRYEEQVGEPHQELAETLTNDSFKSEPNEPPLSKDEVVTKILTVFSMTELLALLEKVKDGLTDEDIAEMKGTLKERLSAEDIEALKQLGKNEFNKYFNNTKD